MGTDSLSRYYRRTWFLSAGFLWHITHSRNQNFGLVFEMCQGSWQPSKKDNTACVSLVRNCHDHFSTVQNQVGEKHHVFLTEKLPGNFFFFFLQLQGGECFFISNKDK